MPINRSINELNNLCAKYCVEHPTYRREFEQLVEVISKYIYQLNDITKAQVKAQLFIYRTVSNEFNQELDLIMRLVKDIMRMRSIDQVLNSITGMVADHIVEERSRIPFTERRLVSKQPISDELKKRLEMKQISVIRDDEDCIWVIEPPLYNLRGKVARFTSTEAKLSEVQELVDNVIARYLAKKSGSTPPPKMIPSYLDLDTSRKVRLEPKSKEAELDKLPVSQIHRANDIIVIENPVPGLAAMMNKRVNPLMRLEKLQEICDSCLKEYREMRDKYNDYKDNRPVPTAA